MLAPSNVSSLLFHLPRRVLFHMEKATSFLPLLSLIDSLCLVLRHMIHTKLMSLAGPFVSPLLRESMLFLNEV